MIIVEDKIFIRYIIKNNNQMFWLGDTVLNNFQQIKYLILVEY